MSKRKIFVDNNWLTDSRFFDWVSKCKAHDEIYTVYYLSKVIFLSNGGICQVLQHKQGKTSLNRSHSRLLGTVSVVNCSVLLLSQVRKNRFQEQKCKCKYESKLAIK